MDNKTLYRRDKQNDEKQQEMQKLNKLVAKSERIIYKISAIFPFDLFPSSIIVDETKITIIDRIFFFSEQIFPITYDNLNSIVVDQGLFFATMRFEISGYNENPAPIKYLWYQSANKARRIILGLIECHKQNIDLSKLDIITVRKKVEEIGRARNKS